MNTETDERLERLAMRALLARGEAMIQLVRDMHEVRQEALSERS